MAFDLFVSSARQDNQQGQATALNDQIQADYRAFTRQDLRCFFDADDIRGMDDR
jgi:hypothetical protein